MLSRSLIALFSWLLAASALSSEPDYIELDSRQLNIDIDSPLDYSFRKPVVFKHYRNRLDQRSAFGRDSMLELNLRSYWLKRHIEKLPDSQAWAAGGELLFNSGWYQEMLALELGAYTSQPVYAPDDQAGTGLLAPGQQGYSALGRANVKLQWGQTRATLYRSELNTPFANKNDSRMTPLLFENYRLVARGFDNIDLFAAWVTAVKPRTSSDFEPLLAHIDKNTDSDMLIAGARYQPNKAYSVGAMAYQIEDYLEILYAEGQGDFTLAGVGFNLALQSIHQQSIGAEVGGEIENDSWGVKLEAEHDAVNAVIAWHQVHGDRVRADWGNYPGYNSVILGDFNRSDERSLRFGVGYQFSGVLQGWSVMSNATWGRMPKAAAPLASDDTELDLTLDYQLSKHYLRHFQLRWRYAKVWRDREQGSAEIEDLRFIINYQLPLF